MEKVYADWIPIEQAASLLGKSRRTLERMIAAGEGPETATRPQPGTKGETVCNPRDIDRLRAVNGKVLMPGHPLLPTPELPAPISMSELVGVVQQLAAGLERLAGAVEKKLLEPAPAPPPRYLTLREASAYLGLSMALLRRLIHAGKVKAILDLGDSSGRQGWKVSITDCDSMASCSSELSQWVAELKQTTSDLRHVVEKRKAAAR